ncbi:MAG: DMT family transporter [Clostridiales bacterium]|nr:DMT family transporter [Clostridiales bacterium]
MLKKLNLGNVRLNYFMMTLLVFLCAFEYILAKPILETVPSLTVIWIKYLFAFAILVCVKCVRDRRFPFRAKDIPLFLLSAVLGEMLYYFGGFEAMGYMPIALVTVVIALSPVLSIAFERVAYRKKVRPPAVAGILVSLFGICLVAGVEPAMVASGRIWGYLLAFLSVVCANANNLVVIKLASRYGSYDLTMYVLGAVALVSTPFAIGQMPPAGAIDASFIGSMIYFVFAIGCFGVFAYINSLRVLGPTTSLLFSNLVPVVSCYFGWLCLGETILPLQLAGGAVTLAGCAVVIWVRGQAGMYSGRQGGAPTSSKK